MGVVRTDLLRWAEAPAGPEEASFPRAPATLDASLGCLLVLYVGKFGTRPAFTQTCLRRCRWPGAYLREGRAWRIQPPSALRVALCAAPDAEAGRGGPAASVSCDAASGSPSCVLSFVCLCALPGVHVCA